MRAVALHPWGRLSKQPCIGQGCLRTFKAARHGYFGMARARYCATIADHATGDEFVYTFYCFAPTFFLARNPTHEEKVDFANQLVTRYNPRALSMKSFGCFICGRLAHENVEWLTYALRDPGCLAVNNSIFPVCETGTCLRKTQVALAIYQRDSSCRNGAVRPLGPEVLSCRICFKHREQVPLQACSRCITGKT